MKIIDISMSIEKKMPVYKNKEEKKPRLTVASDFFTGSCYESELCMNLHTGTHIDMPLHMIPEGVSSDSCDISRYITACYVLDLTHVQSKISDTDLKEKEFPPNAFILLKTRNSFSDSFDPEFVYLDASGALYLKERQVTGIGIDALGIERAQPGHETHITLMQSGIAIIEGLRLAEVAEGMYSMLALPLRISGVEALPARVILTDIKLDK